jgi:hypothetical protein
MKKFILFAILARLVYNIFGGGIFTLFKWLFIGCLIVGAIWAIAIKFGLTAEELYQKEDTQWESPPQFFTATKLNNSQALLQWRVLIGSGKFIIEKSSDKIAPNIIDIGSVNYIDGTHDYQYTDSLWPGLNYYKIVDNEGDVTLSKALSR